MENRKLSNNFWLNEFGGVEPDIRLLTLIQALRFKTGQTISITSGKRTPEDQVRIYRKLEEEKKIATIFNGLSQTDRLLDLIPWGSRHLPCFHNPHLRAVDIIASNGTEYYSGEELKDMLYECRDSITFKTSMGIKGYEDEDLYMGIGVGKTFIHIDFDRKRDTTWGYSY